MLAKLLETFRGYAHALFVNTTYVAKLEAAEAVATGTTPRRIGHTTFAFGSGAAAMSAAEAASPLIPRKHGLKVKACVFLKY